MITRDPRNLFSKLNNHMAIAVEAAAGFGATRGHYEVGPEHLLIKLLETGTGDIPNILSHFEIDQQEVWDSLTKQLDSYKTGNTGRAEFKPVLFDLFEAAWLYTSIHHNQDQIRSGALLEAIISSESLRFTPLGMLLERIDGKKLQSDFIEIVDGSVEDMILKERRIERVAEGEPGRAGTTALELYTIDVTGKAERGELDPVYGRDEEIRQMIDILSRRRKNNPILVGEAGVGKTAIVEGLALRIHEGDVTERLQKTRIHNLDMGMLQAGAGVKGEFENRLKSVINETIDSPEDIILFIDETHTLIGAGGAAGTADAANLLKPALARGKLRTIGATTWSEYKKYIEKDPALERRFQMVKVDEPTEEIAAVMLRGIKALYESHHNVTITDGAIEAAAVLSNRYISGRQLPDKAVDLLDTAAARVKMAALGRPAQLEALDRRRIHLELERKGLLRDIDQGFQVDAADLGKVDEQLEQIARDSEAIQKRWEQEQEVATQLSDLRAKLNAGDGDKPSDDEIVKLREEISSLQSRLAEMQREESLVLTEVNSNVVGSVVSDWTGIPAGRMVRDQATALLEYEKTVGQRIIGQDPALAEIATSIRVSKSGMGNPNAPIGVFLLVGPSGIGKTETALATADVLFGGEKFITTINMSEYQEQHTVSQLKGSPPGYVGYGEGGVLTEAVRRRPYSVVLLDEIEKSHPEIMNLFFQVFDKGFMRDGEGREINFRNTVIMMTSNVGSDTMMQVGLSDDKPNPEDMVELIRPELQQRFQTALLARMKIIPFYPLDQESIQKIVELKLGGLRKRLELGHGMGLEFDADVSAEVARRCRVSESGARLVDLVLDRQLMPDISRGLVQRMMDDQMPEKLVLKLGEDGEILHEFQG